jgi:uncharacterized membrane protein
MWHAPCTWGHSRDPKVHTAQIRQAMQDLITHLRQDVDRVDETRAQVLFETTAEVLEGLIKTYDDYAAGDEVAFTEAREIH